MTGDRYDAATPVSAGGSGNRYRRPHLRYVRLRGGRSGRLTTCHRRGTHTQIPQPTQPGAERGKSP